MILNQMGLVSEEFPPISCVGPQLVRSSFKLRLPAVADAGSKIFNRIHIASFARQLEQGDVIALTEPQAHHPGRERRPAVLDDGRAPEKGSIGFGG